MDDKFKSKLDGHKEMLKDAIKKIDNTISDESIDKIITTMMVLIPFQIMTMDMDI